MADELICQAARRLSSAFALDAALSVPLADAHITVLYGPSGSGKTTLLRVLAGLERPDSGEIRFRNRTWFDARAGISLPPQDRRASFLFQDYALFPHLTVEQNVAYAAKPGKGREMLSYFDLTELAGRMPRSLSGGQQQRVALARALAVEPALLLLDEPLSALDPATRVRTRRDLRRLLTATGVPSIVVTHDRMEAVALGDWVAVMIEGRIRQAGPAPEVFRKPADAQVAEALGVENVLPAEIAGSGNGLVAIRVGPARLECVGEATSPRAWACIRAEDVVLAPNAGERSSARNRIPGRICALTPEGPLARVELDCGFPLVAAITAQSAAEMRLEPGQTVYAVIKATAIHLTL
jgi:molybdate transport system ATP-binding protein